MTPIEIIQAETDVKKLAKWWSEINSFNLPEELKEYNDVGVTLAQSPFSLMGEIINKIGYKECLREWNVGRGTMTNEEFDVWFCHNSIGGSKQHVLREEKINLVPNTNIIS